VNLADGFDRNRLRWHGGARPCPALGRENHLG
jgi:hypothetical protein